MTLLVLEAPLYVCDALPNLWSFGGVAPVGYCLWWLVCVLAAPSPLPSLPPMLPSGKAVVSDPTAFVQSPSQFQSVFEVLVLNACCVVFLCP